MYFPPHLIYIIVYMYDHFVLNTWRWFLLLFCSFLVIYCLYINTMVSSASPLMNGWLLGFHSFTVNNTAVNYLCLWEVGLLYIILPHFSLCKGCTTSILTPDGEEFLCLPLSHYQSLLIWWIGVVLILCSVCVK